MWSGVEVDIPAGWIKCDGNNGTPNLEDLMIVGAGNTWNPGDTGGTAVHTHDFTGDGHRHEISFGGDMGFGADFDKFTDIVPATGITDQTNHMPPYYALIYIMKT